MGSSPGDRWRVTVVILHLHCTCIGGFAGMIRWGAARRFGAMVIGWFAASYYSTGIDFPDNLK